jgi:hypothetical protein
MPVSRPTDPRVEKLTEILSEDGKVKGGADQLGAVEEINARTGGGFDVGLWRYRLVRGMEIQPKASPDYRGQLHAESALVYGGEVFDVVARQLAEGEAKGQTYLKLRSGGWVFNMHPTRCTEICTLEQPCAPGSEKAVEESLAGVGGVWYYRLVVGMTIAPQAEAAVKSVLHEGAPVINGGDVFAVVGRKAMVIETNRPSTDESRYYGYFLQLQTGGWAPTFDLTNGKEMCIQTVSPELRAAAATLPLMGTGQNQQR